MRNQILAFMHYRAVVPDLRSNEQQREFSHKNDDSDLQLKDVENEKQATDSLWKRVISFLLGASASLGISLTSKTNRSRLL